MLTDDAIQDLHNLLEKHKIQHAVLIVPHIDDTFQMALSNVSQEQLWMIVHEINEAFLNQHRHLNG